MRYKGISDENQKSNKNGEREKIGKGMPDENQKTNENGEGREYFDKGINDPKKIEKLEGEKSTSVEKENYLQKRKKTKIILKNSFEKKEILMKMNKTMIMEKKIIEIKQN